VLFPVLFVLPESTAELPKLVVPLFISLILGITLFVLNGLLIRSFEGKTSWLKYGLLSGLTLRNEKECRKLYRELNSSRNKYLNDYVANPNSNSDYSEDLKDNIEKQHINLETKKQAQTLPHTVERVCPTAFGNAYAKAEEYAYERYGLDAVLFWPRLLVLMEEKAPNHFLRITQQKTVVDLSINFTLLAGLIAVETLLEFSFHYTNFPLLAIVLGACLLAAAFYQASVVAIQGHGELVKVSFDYYRGFILQAFNLKTPENLSDEQNLWVKLTTFLQRGEAFYFPEEYRSAITGVNGIEQNIN
jgi:hypothetical protein